MDKQAVCIRLPILESALLLMHETFYDKLQPYFDEDTFSTTMY